MGFKWYGFFDMFLEVCSIVFGISWFWIYSLLIDCSIDYMLLYLLILNICVVIKCIISFVDIWLEKLFKFWYSLIVNYWLFWFDILNLFFWDFKEFEFYILMIFGIRVWVCGGIVGCWYYKFVFVIIFVYWNYCD